MADDSASLPPVVILSSVEWDAAWQRHQALAVQWAEAGRRVYFVENTGFRDPGPRDLPRLWRRALRLLGRRPAASGGAPLPPGLRIVSPLVLPPTWPLFRKINAHLLAPRLVDQLPGLGDGPPPVVVAYLPTATTLSLLRLLAPAVTVYDCVDNFHGHPFAPKDLDRTEGQLLAESDLVLTTSRTLYDRMSRLHRRVVELHHGVSPAFFLPPPAEPRYRRFCYFGTLWKALDYEPVAALARAGFEVDMIGPRKEAPPPLPPGVRLLDAVPHAELPRALADYDGYLLPYARSDYNLGVIPAKIYECLATGRPVLASPLPALEPLGEVLSICRSPQDWVEAARALPRSETPEKRQARLREARRHTQAESFSVIADAVAELSARARPPAGGASERVGAFLRGFTWIGLFYGLAKASTLLTQVAAGRWLGPVEYGKANLVVAAAAYLQILPILGFPLAMSKFLSSETAEPRRRTIISTTAAAFLVWAGAWLAALAALRPALSRQFGLPPPVLDLAILFAYATALYAVLSSPLLGLKRFPQRGLAETLYGLSAPAFLLALIALGKRDHAALILALCLALACATLYALGALRRSLSWSFDRALLAPVLRYALVAATGLLAAAFIASPARLVLHGEHSAESVGVFSAYFTSTVQVGLALLQMLASVLVPLASDAAGQAEGWRLFRRSAPRLLLAAFAAFFAASTVALSLFGRDYPFRADWALLFSAAAALMLIHGVAAILYSARDMRGLRISAAGSLVAGLANAALCLALAPRWHITGAALALPGGYAAGLAFLAGCGLWERRSKR